MKILRPDEKGTWLWRVVTGVLQSVIAGVLVGILFWITAYVKAEYKEHEEAKKFRNIVLAKMDFHHEEDSITNALNKKYNDLQDKQIVALQTSYENLHELTDQNILAIAKWSVTIDYIQSRYPKHSP